MIGCSLAFCTAFPKNDQVCCKKWRLPESGFMKANVDAAFFVDSLEMGLGVIIHDERGHHLFSRSHVMPGLYEPEEGEAIGLHEALSWIKDLGVTKVVIEMDAKNVVDAINGSVEYNSVFGDIIRGCKGLLSLLPLVVVKWISSK
ncbi:hypothetical protein ACS0TY_033480 [Phlomoides rotata]